MKRTNNSTNTRYEFLYFHDDTSISLYNNFTSCYTDIQAIQDEYDTTHKNTDEPVSETESGLVPKINPIIESLVIYFER